MRELCNFLLEVKKEMNNPEIDSYNCSNRFYRSIIYVCGKYSKNRTYTNVGDYLRKISGFDKDIPCCDRRTFEILVDEIIRQNKRTVLDNE